MIHYHGGPITPDKAALMAWRGRHAFVSWAHPEQIELISSVTQSFALDNGAFSAWKSSRMINWEDYYSWSERWLSHPSCDWAIIPDVIDGTEQENDSLVEEWPHGFSGVPVWHMNESVERLERLSERWPRVAIGSTQEFDVSKPSACVARLSEVLPSITLSNGFLKTKLHGLRMLSPYITSRIPLSSGDSTNIARNIKIDKKWTSYGPFTKETRALVLAERIESVVTPHKLLLGSEE